MATDPSGSKLTAQLVTGEKLELGSRPPKLLVIYSQDHPLYRAVVLQLCAFLKSKCGVDVLVDLLDATMVGTVGPMRWLEWQRQQLEYPVDKVVILCSRGVQAKWRAMCGQEGVLLREDVLSPNDDMLVPFLNLFLPSMHRPAALGKYIVAYFEDVSDESDVPSVFALGVKYRLMKHFEELFFRILEMEKYQPGKVNHIEGISKEEYFNCGLGKALKVAIETFRVYQMENPRWFEDECVTSEEDAVAKQNLLNKPPEIGPVHECIPVIREGPPIFVRHVDVIHDERETSSVVEVEPRLNPASQQDLCWSNEPLVNPPVVSVTKQQPHGGGDTSVERVLIAVPLRQEPQPRAYQQRCPGVQGEPGAGGPVEDDEQEDHTLYVSCPWPEERLPTAQFPSHADMENLQQLQLLLGGPQPVEMEEKELLLQLSEKGPSAGSDQGYISKESSQRGGPEPETDPLIALARLQDELFQMMLT